MKGRPYTIRQKIRMAKKVYVFLDPDYKRHDTADLTALIPVSVAQALRIVDWSPRDNEPHGVIDSDGKLILHPPYEKSSK